MNGSDIMAAARQARERSLARWEARDAAVKEAAKREEERIAELKRIRGEKWLPSVPREMKVSFLMLIWWNFKIHIMKFLLNAKYIFFSILLEGLIDPWRSLLVGPSICS